MVLRAVHIAEMYRVCGVFKHDLGMQWQSAVADKSVG